jgi:transcriptional regulator with XRE-family HTH domain
MVSGSEEKLMIHENVEKIREAKGVSKTYLAGKLNMSLQGYRYLVSDKGHLDVERLKVIANALGYEVGVFFNDQLTETVIKQLNEQSATLDKTA